jgi:hypothetical protein
MNRLFVITGLVILVIALVFLNQGINKSGVSDDAAAPPPAAARTRPSPAAAPGPAASTALPAEQAVGNPATATHHIVIGWSYNDTNQQKPNALNAPIQAVQTYVQQNGGKVSAEIVNVDVPAADRSPAAQGAAANGVFVDGKPVFKGDIASVPAPTLLKAIQAATK